MKCEKCNQNEAQFYYKETVNGKTTEKHLCADCAHEEGLDRVFEQRTGDMFREFDRAFESFFAPDPFFNGFFSRRAMPSFARTMLMPMLTLPRIEIGYMEPETEAREEESPAEAKKDEELNRRRELNALRHQLKEAVRTENYEKAIELRDKIKELEKN